MRIKNARLFPTALVIGKRAPAQQFLAVVLKATFRLETSASPARAAETQLPIFDQDVPYDADKSGGLLRYESDRVPFKPRADIVLVGAAYGDDGRETTSVDVRLRVGRLARSLRVVGDRLWSFPSERDPPVVVGPAPFHRMPLTYDRAFGGIDATGQVTKDAPGVVPWCDENYEGRGFVAERTVASLHRKPLPNLEDPADPLRAWNSRPSPTGVGFFPRSSRSRVRHAGTYDERWKTERAPELPLDFSFEYFNGAHPDLQVEGYLRGNEPVLLEGVTARARRLELLLPCLRPVMFFETESAGTGTVGVPGVAESKTEMQRVVPALDTLVFVPDDGVFFVVWRGAVPVRAADAADVHEIRIEYEALPAFAG